MSHFALYTRVSFIGRRLFTTVAQSAMTDPASNLHQRQDETCFLQQPLLLVNDHSLYNRKQAVNDHFNLLLQRLDKCQVHFDEYTSDNTVIQDAAHVAHKTINLTESMDTFQGPVFVTSALRLLLDYEEERFEKYVGSRQALIIPLMELGAASRFRYTSRQFLRVLAFVTLLKKQKSLEFVNLTPALVAEARRRCYICSEMWVLVELVETLYKLLGPEDPRMDEILNIFSKRAVNFSVDINFNASDLASFCYFLSVNDLRAMDSSHLEAIGHRVYTRLKENVYRIDVECAGMVCHFLNSINRLSTSASFKKSMTIWLHQYNEEAGVAATDFTQHHVLHYIGR